MDWSVLPAVFSLIQTIVVVITAVWVYLQLREMKKGTIAQTFLSIVEVIQEPRVQQARKILLNIKNPKYDQWTKNEKESAKIVCSTYDIVGILLKEKILDLRIIIDPWHDSIMKCWNKAQPMITKFQKERDGDFWGHFKNLYEDCLEAGYKLPTGNSS